MPEEISKWRLKDENAKSKASFQSLAEPQKQFVLELENIMGKPLRLTSGRRSPEQKVGKAYKTSKHNTGEAFDLGAEQTDVYNTLMNTPEGLNLLVKYNMGILDETDPEAMKKTKATAEHFHVGTDPYYAKMAKARLDNIQTIAPILSYKERVANGEVIGHTIDDGHDHTYEYEDFSYSPLKIGDVIPDDQIMSRVIGKEAIKAAKINKDEDRKAIEEEKQKELARQEQFFKEFSGVTGTRDNVAQKTYSTPNRVAPIENYEPKVDLQTSLPTMPDIFNYGN